jgi:hypothetical protein
MFSKVSLLSLGINVPVIISQVVYKIAAHWKGQFIKHQASNTSHKSKLKIKNQNSLGMATGRPTLGIER